ncbi:hypothetical protein [Flavobacterium sp.]|uniref:hypothetical protein n=1 Tax=Flavobacterium sp. TaxID=239 RepID=UPI0037527A71
MKQPIIVTKITTNEEGISIFSKNNFDVNKRGGMFLTDQIAAKNFRLRRSDVGYSTQFHLAGDATFIIILKGSLKIELQNGDFIIFNVGESFTAEDNLPESITFNDKIHGHKASVIGDEPLEAIHIKL